MNADNNSESKTCLKVTCTLEPIRATGPASLDLKGQPAIKSARVCGLAVSWENHPDEQLTLQAPDLLHAQPEPEIPPTGNLTSALFEFEFKDDTNPHTVSIDPPDTVTLQFPEDAPKVIAWLDQAGLTASKQLLAAMTAILLAFATAIAPAMGDGDGDDDDPPSDRFSFSV